MELDVKNALDELLSETTGKEPKRQTLLHNVFNQLGLDVEINYPVDHEDSTGFVDLYIPNQNFVVDVKDTKRMSDPYKPGTGGSSTESAYEQISRYVLDLRRSLQNTLFYEENRWIGAVTDGINWWLWKWDNDLVIDSPQPIHSTETPFNLSSSTQFESIIINLIRELDTKEWAPANPTPIFSPYLDDLSRYYKVSQVKKETGLQRNIWLKQLRMSGNHPEEEDQDELFKLHTLLIVISRCMQAQMQNIDEITLDGFAAWIDNHPVLKRNIRDEVENYNWVARQQDVLRPIFNSLIGIEHRKIYGEYYTPDWIAEAMVDKVLDDDWIKNVVNLNPNTSIGWDGIGVLDPTCGSGTFLYHCARKIINSSITKEAKLETQRLSNLVAKLVIGIDIHPVAVEMARTNVFRALPVVPTNELQIYQGDSLMSIDHQGDVLTNEGSVRFANPPQEPFEIPQDLYLASDFSDRIKAIVISALHDTKLSKWVFEDFSRKTQVEIEDVRDSLKNTIEKEGNGVWWTYIRNTASTIALQQRKINRIVGNPPWVTNNKIQDTERKRHVKEMANRFGIMSGGKHSASSDIASLFAYVCPRLYFREKSKSDVIGGKEYFGKCAWLLPQAAIKGGPWKKYRELTKNSIKEIWDVGNMPFPDQNHASVRIEHHPKRSGKLIQRKLIYSQRGKVPTFSKWMDVLRNSKWGKMDVYPDVPSEWIINNTPIPKRGADFFPFCLIKVASISKSYRSTVDITSEGSSKSEIWSQLGQIEGRIQEKYLHRVIFSSDILPFVTSEVTSSLCVAPIYETSSGNFSKVKEPNKIPYWSQASQLYEKFRTNASPPTLWDNLDYLGKLSRQLTRMKRTHVVAYPKSGSNMCASIVPKGFFIDTTCYWIPTESKGEAYFLVAILNCPSLSNAFKVSRESNRDFHLHPWRKIPIPRYDRSKPDHRDISKLGEILVKNASSILESLDCSSGVRYKRNQLRSQLAKQGDISKLEKLIKKLFPKYVR